uniref:DUF4371 domain-containing protein n=1 Tax=Heterorhabditis bacteriophora TaxID=37862 RepID=A0A1I7X3E1_HETBA
MSARNRSVVGINESGNLYSRSPILISSLPLVSQQTSVLDSLQKNLLLHFAKIDTETIFGYGAIELITFLSAGVLSHLLSSLDNRLSFISHAHRRYSAVFTKLFQLHNICPESASRALQIVDGSQRIGEIPNLVLEQVFLIVQEELENSSHYEKYVGSLTIKRDI